jgi:hypothetical protein
MQLVLFICLRGRDVWFSEWQAFSLVKPFIVGEVDLLSYLVVTALFLSPVNTFLKHESWSLESSGKGEE